MDSSAEKRKIAEGERWRILLRIPPIVALVVLLLSLGGAITLLREGGFGTYGFYAIGTAIGGMVMALLVILRKDELTIMVVMIVQIYVDWYIGLHIVSVVIAIALLATFYLACSQQYPWAGPRVLWLWFLYFGLALVPAIRGATNPYDAAYYYPNIIVGAFIFFCIGIILARDSAMLRRVFRMLAILGALLAMHTIVQAMTGKVFLGTAHFDTFLASKSFYQLLGSDAHRIGSFFIDPNWNGAFFAMTLFIPLALFVEGSFLGKVLYIAEVFLMLVALLFTYSTGGWLATFAGTVAFLVFVGRARYRILLPVLVVMAAVVVIVFFPDQLALQLQHASSPGEVTLRVAAWKTAIRMISAYPLTGVGLGLNTYGYVAEAYRVPDQYVALPHPHDSYLEIGAMAGLPVLVVFVALLLTGLWEALRNWLLADSPTRPLLGGGIAAIIALSANSVTINGWTLPPLAVLGWLLLGMISSPLLVKSSKEAMEQKKSNAVTSCVS